jgi:4-diphosphocytidyl-2-C-methyl-D-erythritol kinase
VLANPGVKVATKAAFAAFALEPGQMRAQPVHALQAQDQEAIMAIGRNDFEPTAMAEAPAIGETLQRLRSSEGCRLARMSGSGATCVGLFADCRTAARAARALKAAHPGWWIESAVLR